MKRYFFHLRRPMGFSPDDVGIHLPDQAVVTDEAIKAVRHIIKASPQNTPVDWMGRKIEGVSAAA